MSPPTARIYWENPRAKTALAKVTARAGDGFLLDRSIYHASVAGYHHAQPCDLGHALVDGHKLKIVKVAWDRGRLVHRTSGPPPKVGSQALLHLDDERRQRNARAHAALHLLIQACAESYATFTADPHLVGGAEARIACKFREDARTVLPRVLSRANALAKERHDITTRWAPRDEARKHITHDPVPLAEIAPGEPTLRLVACGPGNVMPCDAPMCSHTWEIGDMKLGLVQISSQGVRFGVKVQ